MAYWVDFAQQAIRQSAAQPLPHSSWVGPFPTMNSAENALIAGPSNPTGPPSGPTRQQLITQYANLISRAYDAKLGNDYRRYMASHPSADPAGIYNQVVARVQELGGIARVFPRTIAAIVSGTAKSTAQAGAGISAGAAQIAAGLDPFQGGILGFLSTLTNPHTWLRVAEVAVGIVLMAVALGALLKESIGVNPVQAAVKATPAGRVLKAVS